SFFFHESAPTEIYTLSLHDALPIWLISRADRRESHRFLVRDPRVSHSQRAPFAGLLPSQIALKQSQPTLRLTAMRRQVCGFVARDRKSTRLNSSHVAISYAVFCLKK